MMRIGEVSAIVGNRRFKILTVLLAVVILLVFAWQFWQLPQYVSLTAERDATQGEIVSLRQEIKELPAHYAQMKENETRYESFITQGFIGEQDRIVARKRLDTLRAANGLRGIDYNIMPQVRLATAPEYTGLPDELAKSEVKVTFKALTDIEVRDFVAGMHNNFSGLTLLKSFTLVRENDVNAETLAALGQHAPINFITGEAFFDWYSLVPRAINPNAVSDHPEGEGP